MLNVADSTKPLPSTGENTLTEEELKIYKVLLNWCRKRSKKLAPMIPSTGV